MLDLSIWYIKLQLCLKEPIKDKSNITKHLILSIDNMVNLKRTIFSAFVEVDDILFPLEASHRWTFVLHEEFILGRGAIDGRFFEEAALVFCASTDSTGVFDRLVNYEMVLAKSNAQ